MRFGLFHNLHDLTKQRDYADLLDELRELAAIATRRILTCSGCRNTISACGDASCCRTR
jgi:hypothetical protein